MVLWLVCAVGVVLSVMVAAKVYVDGGGDGGVPERVMVAPLFPLGDSHDGRLEYVQPYGGVPPEAVQLAV
jgi:hypothetical protein